MRLVVIKVEYGKAKAIEALPPFIGMSSDVSWDRINDSDQFFGCSSNGGYVPEIGDTQSFDPGKRTTT